MSDKKIFRNDPCPCGSGKKYKHCCYQKTRNAGTEAEPARKKSLNPIGTVALYGPDDKTTTKIAASVILYRNAVPILKRWVSTDILTNPKVQLEIKDFFRRYGVKEIVTSDGNMGCPHEEGLDFPNGEDCPFCPFWRGKQGSNRRE